MGPRGPPGPQGRRGPPVSKQRSTNYTEYDSATACLITINFLWSLF